MISVVIPAFNEEENIRAAASAISAVLSGEEYELIFVDDGSKDKSWDEIVSVSDDPHIRGLRFSRNFGKESAIRAGLEASRGDATVVIDCDLQHPPAAIPEMIKKWRDGAKVVEGKKSSRGSEARTYGFLAKVFNSMMSRITGLDMSGASDFILLDRTAAEAVLSYGELGSFFRSLAQYVGFESDVVYYNVAAREHGGGSWTFKKLFAYAAGNLAAFSAAPLYLSIWLGGLTVSASVILLILKLCGVDLGSFSAGIVALMLIGGLILVVLGIVGFYLARIYSEVKRRPKYIIASETKERK